MEMVRSRRAAYPSSDVCEVGEGPRSLLGGFDDNGRPAEEGGDDGAHEVMELELSAATTPQSFLEVVLLDN